MDAAVARRSAVLLLGLIVSVAAYFSYDYRQRNRPDVICLVNHSQDVYAPPCKFGSSYIVMGYR